MRTASATATATATANKQKGRAMKVTYACTWVEKTADSTALLAALEADPLDTTTRLIYADWCEEHSDVIGAASHREVAQRAGKTQHMDWDNPFAQLLMRHDHKEFKASKVNPSKHVLKVTVRLFVDDYDNQSGWRVHPADGIVNEHGPAIEKPEQYRECFYVHYTNDGQHPNVYIHPNLFAEILIREGFGG